MPHGIKQVDLVPADRPQAIDPALVESVLIKGDLRQLSAAQKVSYYKAVCDSLGLNPLTQPFAYITLNGKEVLYAKRDAAEQLRKVHGISITITAREVIEGCYIVTAQASMLTGRKDESTGAVPIDKLAGEARANALMKAETKAKRRVTLSICGLGMLDETEVEAIADASPFPAADAARVVPTEKPEGYDDWWADMTALADDGITALQTAWGQSKVEYRRYLTALFAKQWEALKAKARLVEDGEVAGA
jgi:hypothetical protein